MIEKPQMTTYMYGSHAVTDEGSGETYALQSESVNLDAYVGEKVTVSGTTVPGYENGQVEGGPTLLEVSGVEPAGPLGEAAVAFELTVEGEVPKNVSFYVESSAGPGGVICTTDGAANEQGGYPRCEGDGRVNRAEISVPAGEPFDYRILTSRGAETSRSVVAESSEVAESGLVIEASYSFAGAPPGGQDINGDGAVDAADGEFAAQVSDAAKDDVDPSGGRALPVTGGAALAILLAGSALAGAGFLAHRTVR